MTTEYYQLTLKTDSDHDIKMDLNLDSFDKVKAIGQGSQSIVLDTELFVEKRTTLSEFNNLHCLLHCPLDNLKIYSPNVIGSNLTFYSKKVKKLNITPKKYMRVLSNELKLLHSCNMAYNDLCRDNIISGHLIDPGLVNYEGARLHKARLELLYDKSNPISSKSNDIHSFKVLSLNLFNVKLKGDNLDDLMKEFDESWKVDTLLQTIIGLSIGFLLVCFIVTSMFVYVRSYSSIEESTDGNNILLKYNKDDRELLESLPILGYVSLSLFLLILVMLFLKSIIDKHTSIC